MSLTRRFNRMTGLRQQFSRLFEEGLAGLGQLNSAFVAREELNPQLLLQQVNLAAQWRLCDLQPLRRFAEIQMLRNGDEISNMTQFHSDVFRARSAGETVL